MLKQMRESSAWMIKGVLWAVVLAFVVTIFYSWGVQSSSGPARTEVATLWGQGIEAAEFQRTQNALYRQYRQVFGNQPDVDLREHFNFRQMALEQIVSRALLLRIAEENRLEVTDTELYAHLTRQPSFQNPQGQFDSDRYRVALASVVPPVSMQQFEDEQRRSLMQSKVFALVQQGAQITDAEAEQTYRHEHQQVNVRYVTLVPSLFEAEATVSDEEVKTHYETYRESYREPERRQIRYLTVTAEPFRVTREFSEDELQAYYDSQPEALVRRAEARARHILFRLPENASAERQERVRSLAQSVLDDLRGGADFAAAAAEHSEDDGTAEAGGDLGFFPRGRMMPPLEEAAFSLPIGELSDPVRTELGFHILRVEERMETGIKPLEEALQEVIDALQDEKAREAALVFVDDLVVAMDEAPERFAELADQHGLEVETTPFVEAAGFIEELTGAPQLIGRAFSLRAQTVDAMVGRNGNHYIFQVAETQPDKVPPLEDIVERVTRDARDSKGADLASETGAEWVTQLRDGASLAELAGALELQVTETGWFRRNEPVPDLGNVSEFRRAAFQLQPNEGEAVGEGDRTYVVQVIEYRDAGMSTFKADLPDYRRQLLAQKQNQLVQAFQESLAAQFQQLLRDGDLVVNSQYVF
jgi:peptidyl-prolyl cis-trans isomerase D